MHAAAFHLAARPLKVVFEEFSFLLALLATCEVTLAVALIGLVPAY